MPDLVLASRSAFSAPLPAGAGLHIEEHRDIGLATVMALVGQYDALSERARAAFGVVPPDGSSRAAHDGVAFIGTGPGTWLAASENPSGDFAAELARTFDGVATVSDQSSGYAVLRIGGARARSVLQSGVPLDLHPQAFAHDACAVTIIAHIGVILWQIDGETFEIAFFRSMADSFAHWLGVTIGASA